MITLCQGTTLVVPIEAKTVLGFSRCQDVNDRKQIPQELNPNTFFDLSSARLKSCPDTYCSTLRVLHVVLMPQITGLHHGRKAQRAESRRQRASSVVAIRISAAVSPIHSP
jgi:hypothetical protein